MLYEGKTGNHIALYGAKDLLLEFLKTSSIGKWTESRKRRIVTVDRTYQKFQVPHGHTIKSRVEWFGGYLDSDGAVSYHYRPRLLIDCVEHEFLQETRLMLQTLGVFSSVRKVRDRRFQTFHGRTFYCQEAFRLFVGTFGTYELIRLGLAQSTHRLKLVSYLASRNFSSERAVSVNKVCSVLGVHSTYCLRGTRQDNRASPNGILVLIN